MLCASAQPPTLTAAFAAYGLESYDAGGDADAGGRGLRASPAGPGLRAGARDVLLVVLLVAALPA